MKYYTDCLSDLEVATNMFFQATLLYGKVEKFTLYALQFEKVIFLKENHFVAIFLSFKKVLEKW